MKKSMKIFYATKNDGILTFYILITYKICINLQCFLRDYYILYKILQLFLLKLENFLSIYYDFFQMSNIKIIKVVSFNRKFYNFFIKIVSVYLF